MLIRLILSPADKHRSGANQMRQHLSFREHFRRGNATSYPDCRATFDVTPARLVTALITERGICPASREGSSNCSRSGGGGSLENSAGEKGSGWTTQPSGTERRLEIF
jgi:hypothetical protein